MTLIRCRPIAGLLLTLHLAGCVSWQPSPASPPQLIQDEKRDQVRPTRMNGDRVVVRDPEIWADPIAGSIAGAHRTFAGASPVEDRRMSGENKLFIVVVAIVVAWVVALRAACWC